MREEPVLLRLLKLDQLESGGCGQRVAARTCRPGLQAMWSGWRGTIGLVSHIGPGRS